MSEELQTDFEGGDAGASKVYPAQCSSLRKNGHVVIKVSLSCWLNISKNASEGLLNCVVCMGRLARSGVGFVLMYDYVCLALGSFRWCFPIFWSQFTSNWLSL